MPWNMNDYPASLKNLPELVRKKAIDIANALLEEDYPEDRAIPIATSQAEKWYKDASKEEKESYKKEKSPQKNDSHGQKDSNSDLIDNDVEVFHEEKGWKVQTKGAKRADHVFSTKQEAIDRGKEMVKNKKSVLHVYKKDGDHEKDIHV